MDTKIAFVAAGPKHTLCIDTEGNLWYFGNKESVGIESIERN
jgi:alpha-tubulin suppressor-like RCC1 family protein